MVTGHVFAITAATKHYNNIENPSSISNYCFLQQTQSDWVANARVSAKALAKPHYMLDKPSRCVTAAIYN